MPLDTLHATESQTQLLLRAAIRDRKARQAAEAEGLTGRSVLVAADFVHRSPDGRYRGRVLLDAPADRVTIDFLDGEGLILHSISAEAPASMIDFAWDGRGDFGLAQGRLRIRVVARNGIRAVATITNVWTPVVAIDTPSDGGAIRLVTPSGAIAPDAAIAVD